MTHYEIVDNADGSVTLHINQDDNAITIEFDSEELALGYIRKL